MRRLLTLLCALLMMLPLAFAIAYGQTPGGEAAAAVYPSSYAPLYATNHYQ